MEPLIRMNNIYIIFMEMSAILGGGESKLQNMISMVLVKSIYKISIGTHNSFYIEEYIPTVVIFGEWVGNG